MYGLPALRLAKIGDIGERGLEEEVEAGRGLVSESAAAAATPQLDDGFDVQSEGTVS